MIPPTAHEVGKFIDEQTKTSKYKRQPVDVTGRLIEEVVELALHVGLTVGQINEHVTDAIYNQAAKLSHKLAKTIFPSELDLYMDNSTVAIADEVADVLLVSKDLIYVLDITQTIDWAMGHKWSEFIKKEFNVSAHGCLYAKKPHIIAREG